MDWKYKHIFLKLKLLNCM